MISTSAPTSRVTAYSGAARLIDEPTDIRGHWRDNLVAFVLGCSFSFEEALIEDGIELRHMTCGATVPLFRTVSDRPGGPVPWAACRLHAANDPRESDPRHADHDPLPGGAWGAGAHRQARSCSASQI